jgi:hypothetical protein
MNRPVKGRWRPPPCRHYGSGLGVVKTTAIVAGDNRRRCAVQNLRENRMTTETAAIRDSLRDDLERARTQYIDLLDSLAPADWERTSANPAWNVRQLMWHMAWSLGMMPRGLAQLRKERGLNPPASLLNGVNTWITRVGARKATPASVRQKYEAAHESALIALESVADGDWGKGARVFGEQRTVESTFRAMREHVEEHVADIRRGLGRAS